MEIGLFTTLFWAILLLTLVLVAIGYLIAILVRYKNSRSEPLPKHQPRAFADELDDQAEPLSCRYCGSVLEKSGSL